VHEENLFAWVSSVTKFYYQYHLKKYNNLKKVLSAKVSHYVDSKLPREPKSYDKSEFTTFELTFEQYRNTIRVDTKLAKEVIGPDTYFRLHADTDNEDSKGEGKKRRRGNSLKRQPGIKSGQESLSCDIEETAGRSRSQPAKRSRSQPVSYHEESDPDSDAETSVKMEAVMENNESNHDLGCVDLCESSDEEGNGRHHDEDLHKRKTTNAGSHSKPAASQPVTERNKIHDLEQALKRLRRESNSKIMALETENKELKKQLLQKGKVISVLKRRVGV